jgi:gliding motility-associated-like protein
MFLLCGSVFSQNIIIDDTPTPTDLVTNTLIGPGLVTSNITFTGSPQQIGFFEANGSNIGLDSGVVMSSGFVTNIVPPNFPSTVVGGPGDADVLATAQSVTSNPAAGSITSTFDAAVLEFDFVPNGDVVLFNFVFASEEYLTWVNTQYNDAFGFYITGPNPAGGNYNVQNLALVPNTTEPITISTIYPGLNAQYYIDNPASLGHSFNGFTIPIEIRFDVLCDSTYHFKFAVADCSDGILDTGVFLDGGSFQAVPVDLTLETNIGNGMFGDSVIFEGCGTTAEFIFTRPSCQSLDSLYVNIAISGSATNGVDYATLPDSVLFMPGSTEVIIPFWAFQDGIFEGYEDVIITVTSILPNGDTIITIGIVWLLDNLNVDVFAQDTIIVCRQDSIPIFAFASDGVPPYVYSWNTSSLNIDSIYVPADPNGTIDYYVTVTDTCGFTDTDTLTVIVAQTLSIDTLLSFPTSACNPDGAVSAIVSGVTDSLGQPYYHWNGPGAANPNFIDATVWQNITSGWYYFEVTDDVCAAYDSVFVEMENPPIASFTASPNSGCTPLDVTFTNNSQNTSSYVWDFGNGTVITVNNNGSQSQTYTQSTTAMLVAFADPTCSDTAYVNISIIICGCMDPNALNYNPDAVSEDGSCIYPVPVVIAPNIFTPNGDGDNDFFFFDTEYTIILEYTILNRWGNTMFDQTIDLSAGNTQLGWDGTSSSGAEAEEGTYFYKYFATGIDGTQISGHGFLQLARD